jgi:hypothetical protein
VREGNGLGVVLPQLRRPRHALKLRLARAEADGHARHPLDFEKLLPVTRLYNSGNGPGLFSVLVNVRAIKQFPCLILPSVQVVPDVAFAEPVDLEQALRGLSRAIGRLRKPKAVAFSWSSIKTTPFASYVRVSLRGLRRTRNDLAHERSERLGNDVESEAVNGDARSDQRQEVCDAWLVR